MEMERHEYTLCESDLLFVDPLERRATCVKGVSQAVEDVPEGEIYAGEYNVSIRTDR